MALIISFCVIFCSMIGILNICCGPYYNVLFCGILFSLPAYIIPMYNLFIAFRFNYFQIFLLIFVMYKSRVSKRCEITNLSEK